MLFAKLSHLQNRAVRVVGITKRRCEDYGRPILSIDVVSDTQRQDLESFRPIYCLLLSGSETRVMGLGVTRFLRHGLVEDLIWGVKASVRGVETCHRTFPATLHME